MILPPIPCISSPSDLDGPAYLERISWSHIIKGPCVSVEGVLSLSFGDQEPLKVVSRGFPS